MRAVMRQTKTWTIILLVISLVLFYQSIFGHNGLRRRYQRNSLYQELTAKIATLQGENKCLGERISHLRLDDKSRLEERAREELDMVYPGEVIYKFQH